MKALLVALLSAGTLLVSTVPGYSVPILNFSTGSAGPGGGLTILGPTDAMGVNIPVDSLIVMGAPTNNGVFDLSGTAPSTDVNKAASLDFSVSGNTITIVGGIPGLGIGDGTLLLKRTFNPGTTITGGGVVGFVSASGPDSTSPLLLLALDLPIDTPFEFWGFSIGVNPLDTGSPYLVVGTNIANAAVPEPASLLLLGSGFVGVAAAIRRRRRAHLAS